jgi:hypothetical protein
MRLSDKQALFADLIGRLCVYVKLGAGSDPGSARRRGPLAVAEKYRLV